MWEGQIEIYSSGRFLINLVCMWIFFFLLPETVKSNHKSVLTDTHAKELLRVDKTDLWVEFMALSLCFCKGFFLWVMSCVWLVLATPGLNTYSTYGTLQSACCFYGFCFRQKNSPVAKIIKWWSRTQNNNTEMWRWVPTMHEIKAQCRLCECRWVTKFKTWNFSLLSKFHYVHQWQKKHSISLPFFSLVTADVCVLWLFIYFNHRWLIWVLCVKKCAA